MSVSDRPDNPSTPFIIFLRLFVTRSAVSVRKVITGSLLPNGYKLERCEYRMSPMDKKGEKSMQKQNQTDDNHHAANGTGAILKRIKRFIRFVLHGGWSFRRHPYVHIVQYSLKNKRPNIAMDTIGDEVQRKTRNTGEGHSTLSGLQAFQTHA
jgi:hypothetical protein